MRIGIPAESVSGENRVAASPKSVAELKKVGFEVLIAPGAGQGASFDDSAYLDAGAELTDPW